MLKIKRVDHIAVGVVDLDEAARRWRQFGFCPGDREKVESQKVEVVLLPAGDTSIELISSRGNDSLSRFLEARGPAALHHVALEVEGIEEALSFLASLGVPLIDKTPREGARGHKVAFVHPKATGGVLVELVEPRKGGGAAPAR